jgi:hypothetical protein
MSEPTFYRWKKQSARMGPVDIRRLKPLEEENAKLKQLVRQPGRSITALSVLARTLVGLVTFVPALGTTGPRGTRHWPAAGFVDTEIRFFNPIGVRDAATSVRPRVQA